MSCCFPRLLCVGVVRLSGLLCECVLLLLPHCLSPLSTSAASSLVACLSPMSSVWPAASWLEL